MLDSRVTPENVIVGVVGEDGIDDELLPIGYFARLSGLSVHTGLEVFDWPVCHPSIRSRIVVA